ncbi:zinc transporter ZIP6, partial [Lucilia sericata]|uniref:zinc transporter ZIP6 n=1 Tax=Lucilia sericata TaxID=13632 RepID=UPI0018A87FD1
GLEHLMYSLGLGQIEFEASHTIDEHHPHGLSNNLKDHEEMKSYMDIQTIKLLPDDDDVQIAQKKSQEKTSGHENDSKNDKDIILEFKEMHDPKHRHPRENEATFDGTPLSANVCLSPKSLLRLVVDHDDLHKRKLYKTFTSSSAAASSLNAKMEMNNHDHDLEEEYNHFINNVRLTPVAFMKLCPALLAQIDQQVCIQSLPMTHANSSKGVLWNAWIYASASIFILSACGLLGILLVPLMKTVAYQEILNFLVAVAVGTLSGDALMHLIPHALASQHSAPESHEHHHKEESSHKHDTSVIWICACAFFTALFMYIIETLLPLLKGDNAEGSHGHSHHSHSHPPTQKNNEKPLSNPMPALGSEKTPEPSTADVGALNIMLNEAKLDMKKPSRPLTPVAFMVVIGDGLHNLTDGLAIGAAFASDPVTGLATAFAVLCHELPHELGDFALLLQTGVSMRRAICLNIVSSVLSFVGMAIGLLIANLHTNMTQWIYAGTAGSFLYIAFADLVPAMANEAKGKLKSSLVQVIGIIIGGLIMLVIAINEDALEELFN